VAHHPPLQRKYSPAAVVVGDGCQQHPDTPPLPPMASSSVSSGQRNNNNHPSLPDGDKKSAAVAGNNQYKIKHQSPIPERKHMSKEKEEERRDCKVRNYSPQAFKFFMEQHVENVLKSHKQRLYRRFQLETEMQKIGLSAEAQCQMRKMLSQKESNYIRLVLKFL
jgi:serine/threonine-protein kinase LATS1/2